MMSPALLGLAAFAKVAMADGAVLGERDLAALCRRAEQRQV
jgi:hypothetical protein